jgi:hypothetical protein
MPRSSGPVRISAVETQALQYRLPACVDRREDLHFCVHVAEQGFEQTVKYRIA